MRQRACDKPGTAHDKAVQSARIAPWVDGRDRQAPRLQWSARFVSKWYVFYEGDRVRSALARFIDILRYSIEPYDGRLLVNGGHTRAMFGELGRNDFTLLVEFPHRQAAEEWYQSALFGLILEKAKVWPDGRLLMLEGAA